MLTSGSFLTLHFLSSSLWLLSFSLLPLSFSHCLTRYLISCLLSTSHPGWWQSTQQRGLRKDSLCCINAVLGKLMGEIWLSHSNLCRVKHWSGRENVGSVNTEENHCSLKEAALVLISLKSKFWIRISVEDCEALKKGAHLNGPVNGGLVWCRDERGRMRSGVRREKEAR